MEQGLEYSFSKRKRTFDLAFAATMAIPALLTEGFVTLTYGRLADSPIYQQKRIGRFSEPFIINKLVTLDPITGQPYSRLASAFRRYAIDEFAQVANIFDSTMSAVGRRPLIPSELKEFMDHIPSSVHNKYSRVVMATKPGVLSTFGILSHKGFLPTDDVFLIRAELDIQDVVDGSIRHDLAVTGSLITSAINGRLV